MNLRNWPPIFMPTSDSYENISKAALADIAWNLAARCASSADDIDEVIGVFQGEADRVLSERKRYQAERAAAGPKAGIR